MNKCDLNHMASIMHHELCIHPKAIVQCIDHAVCMDVLRKVLAHQEPLGAVFEEAIFDKVELLYDSDDTSMASTLKR